jgi:hypothetical protein
MAPCLWGSVTGAVLVVGWLLALLWLARPSAFMERSARRTQADGEEMAPLRLLLDQMPTPLVGIEGKNARALNRPRAPCLPRRTASRRCLPPCWPRRWRA